MTEHQIRSQVTGNTYFPDFVYPPGETLRELLEEKGMSQVDLSRRIGKTTKTINEIIQGKAPITPETALDLEKVFSVPAHVWNNLELQYREFLAEETETQKLAQYSQWFRKFPASAMVKIGFLKPFDSQEVGIRNLLRFFGVSSPRDWENTYQVLERRVVFRKAEQSCYESVSAWLRAGEIVSQNLPCSPFNKQTFMSILVLIKALTRLHPDKYCPRLIKLCAQAGVAVVFIPEIPGTRTVRGSRVSGATRWLNPNKALIQLSLRYKTDDHLWFTFFHEAGHLLLHGKTQIFIEDDGSHDRSELEDEANAFAAEFLVPNRDYRAFLNKLAGRKPNKIAIEEFADQLGIAPSIVLGRLQFDRILPYDRFNELKQRLELQPCVLETAR